jgi:hypothetical protein
MSDTPQEQTVIQATQRWISDVVVALNLCPFAAPVVNSGRIAYRVSPETDIEGIYRDLLLALDEFQRQESDQVATGFLILSQGLASFDDYLDFLEMADDMLVEAGLDGVIQIAGFHPDYCFSDSDDTDPANYTNRSPYPMFHLIREDDLEAAVASHPDPEGIPDRNILLLRELGLAEVQQRLQGCFS